MRTSGQRIKVTNLQTTQPLIGMTKYTSGSRQNSPSTLRLATSAVSLNQGPTTPERLTEELENPQELTTNHPQSNAAPLAVAARDITSPLPATLVSSYYTLFETPVSAPSAGGQDAQEDSDDASFDFSKHDKKLNSAIGGAVGGTVAVAVTMAAAFIVRKMKHAQQAVAQSSEPLKIDVQQASNI